MRTSKSEAWSAHSGAWLHSTKGGTSYDLEGQALRPSLRFGPKCPAGHFQLEVVKGLRYWGGTQEAYQPCRTSDMQRGQEKGSWKSHLSLHASPLLVCRVCLHEKTS